MSPVGEPRLVDPGTGGSASAVTLDFGRVRVLEQARLVLRVRNDGPATVSITAIQPSEAFPSDAFSYPTSPFNVGPGREASLEITFHPTQPLTASGSLMLVVENGDQNSLTVALTGTGYEVESPELIYAPAQLAFDRAMVSTVALRHLTLANDGSDVAGTTADNLHFGAYSTDGTFVENAPEIVGLDAADFSLDWPPAGYGADEGVPPGQSVDLRVRFHPSAETVSQAMLVITSSDRLHSRVEIPLSGRGVPLVPCPLSVAPRVLNFGSVEKLQTQSQSFSIANQDSDGTHFCQITVELAQPVQGGAAFALAVGLPDTLLVAAGETLEVPVAFTPPARGAFDGEVVLQVAGPIPTEERVALGGVGLSTCVRVAPRELDFGAVSLSCNSRQQLVTIYNSCGSRAVVETIDPTTQGSRTFFVSKKPALPMTLAGGSQVDFGVTFHPVDVGEQTGMVLVSIQGREPIALPVLGHGTPQAIQTDIFSIYALPKVDILFVVDNSSTMADKQSALARNFASFINFVVQQPVNYHIAVTTTDVTSSGAAGRLVPLTGTNPTVIDRSTPNKLQVFSQNIAVGTSGSETESLLYPAYLALTSPLVGNQGFYRADAKLAIVIVSDAADQDPLANSPTFYESFLDNLKGATRRNDVTLSAVIPTATQAPSSCTYDTANAGLDTRVAQLVQHTGGLLDDICNPDWVRTFERLGTRTFGLRSTFFLSNTPDMTVTPDPIIVTVNQQPVPQYGPKGDR